MYIMAPETISKAYVINPSHQSVNIYVLLGKGSPYTFPRQRIQQTIYEVLDVRIFVFPYC
jgi:hypothetical protein